jgi:hypothetical protein
MRALGASRFFILVQVFLRSLIVSFTASSLSFLILFMIDHYNILSIIEMDIGNSTFFFTWLISLSIINIFIIRFYMKTSKISISEILK